MLSNCFKFFVLPLFLLCFGNNNLMATSSSKEGPDTETPASETVPSYKNSDVGDFYLSANGALHLSKLSRPSMKGSGVFINLSMDHFSDGNLAGIFASENGFSFNSFEYSAGKFWFSKESDDRKIELNVLVPIQVMLKKSYGVQSSRSGILSMIQFGLGVLISTDVEGTGNNLTEEEIQNKTYKKTDNLDDWGVGISGTVGYELSVPVISYTGFVNVGFRLNASLVDISGKLNIKDGNSKFSTPGHLFYYYATGYVGMRFAL